MGRTIFLKAGRGEGPIRKEALADAGITPGHLIERTATGVKVHATAGGVAPALFAVENALEGKQTDHAYVADERVQFEHYGPGDEISAILAQGETVTIGSMLESAGDGTLQVSAETASEIPGSVVAQALEALDLSTSSLSATALKVEII